MNNKHLLSVSITSSDYFDIQNTISSINNSVADKIHFDVMDGIFVPNITYGPDFISSIRPHSSKFFDVHLMLSNPFSYIKNFVSAGADSIAVHIESEKVIDSLQLIKSCGKKASIVLNPETDCEALIPYLPFVDEVLLMSVHPGFGGQTFLTNTFDKLGKLLFLVKNFKRKIFVVVDGGINFDNAKFLLNIGADCLVVGSFLFKQKNFSEAVLKFKNL